MILPSMLLSITLAVSLLPIALHASPSFVPSIIHVGPRVDTKQAEVIGSRKFGVDTFNGVPYAHPPVGDLRLRPPKRLTAKTNTVVAKGQPRQCVQMQHGNKNEGEDCLTLNIQRPSSAKETSKLPVVVWMYGGGFEDGSTQIYNARHIIRTSMKNKKPIVYAEMNYRLGAFGFLAGKEVLKEGVANLGLLDQRLALEWVADNIEHFGGDPSKITIWGESAGSISVFDQMAMYNGDHSYKGKPLFRAGMMDSGSIVPTNPVDCEKAQEIFDKVAKRAGCGQAEDKLDCLRKIPYAKFAAASNSVPSLNSYKSLALSYLPRPDGKTLTASPEVLVEEGKYAKVPFIVGDQADEGTIFARRQKNITTTKDVVDYLYADYFPTAPRSRVDRLVHLYSSNPAKGAPFGTGKKYQIYPQYKRLAALLGDIIFILVRRRFLNLAHATFPNVPSWSYLATYENDKPVVGTAHTSDIPYAYGDQRGFPGDSIQAYYLSFINTMDPNDQSGGLTHWPRWDQGHKLLNFEKTKNSIIADDFRERQYKFLADKRNVLRL